MLLYFILFLLFISTDSVVMNSVDDVENVFVKKEFISPSSEIEVSKVYACLPIHMNSIIFVYPQDLCCEV